MKVEVVRLADMLLDSVRDAVLAHTFTEKVLLSDDLGAAHTLLRRLAIQRTPWVNVRCATIATLAQELAAADLDRHSLTLADPVMTLLLTADLMHSVPQAAVYFRSVADTPGTLRAVHRTLTDLRLHEARPADLAPALLDPDKARALSALLEAFGQSLAQRRWADDAEVFRAAIDSATTGGSGTAVLYLVPRGLRATGLARRFLDALPQDRVLILDQDEPAGLPIPASRWARPAVAPRSAGGLLSDLFAGGGPQAGIELFAGVAAAAEVREALRRIVARGTVWEDVELLVARDAPYMEVLRDAAARMEIPVTFAHGTPVVWTRPGRAAAALAGWLREDFPARQLADALAAGDLQPSPDRDGDAPTGTRAARLLRGAAIGWGRDRYEPALLVLRDSFTRPTAGGEDEPEEPAWMAERRRQIDALRTFLAALLAGCPPPDTDGLVALADVCRWLGGAVELYAAVTGDDDGAAKAALTERLRLAARWAGGSFAPWDAADRALALVSDLRVGASGPRPGHLHVAPAAGGSSAGRAHTYLLGLDEASFAPGGGVDPLLLDEERRALTPPLPGSAAAAADRLYRLGLTLGSLRGGVCFSYSVREAGTDRAVFPSPVLLQAFRLATGRPDAGYAELERHLGTPAGYSPAPGAPPLGRDEAWLGGIAAGPVLAEARGTVLEAYPYLARGQELRAARMSPQVTPYDGQIDPDPERLDPRRNRELVVSASRLEQLANCPLAYLFRYVLGIVPLEEIAREPGRWLDPAQRGSLLHAVYRRFYERLGGAVAGDPGEERLIDEVSAEALAEVREAVPPPSEAVYERERDEILHAARVFLAVERREGGREQPVLFEVPFGFGPGSVPAGSPGSEEPVEVPVATGGSIRVRGQIDRIDRVAEHLYRIWDYKTGRPYDEGGTLLRGRRVQHALYGEAAERLLRASGADPEARVDAAGYRFPTERGEGRSWLPDEDGPKARVALAAALADLLDLVAAGTFVAAEDAAACRWCDFRAACDAEEAAGATKRKLAEAGNAALDPLRRIASVG